MKLCTLTAAQHRDLGFSFPCIIRLELEWPRSQDANSIREYASIRGFWYETVYSISNTNIWMSAMLLILFYSCWFSLGSWYLWFRRSQDWECTGHCRTTSMPWIYYTFLNFGRQGPLAVAVPNFQNDQLSMVLHWVYSAGMVWDIKSYAQEQLARIEWAQTSLL